MYKRKSIIIIALVLSLILGFTGCTETDSTREQNNENLESIEELAKKREKKLKQKAEEKQEELQNKEKDLQIKGNQNNIKRPSQKNTKPKQQKESQTGQQNTSKQEVKQGEQAADKYEQVKVVEHVDGDTVYIKLPKGQTEKVRFIGINTPESTTRHEPYGEEAAKYTKSKLLGEIVYVEKDVSNRDQYGRLLRYIWLEPPEKVTENEIRSKMFNAILVLEGYAQAATYPPDVKYADYFKKFQREARKKGKGLWGLKEEKESRSNQSQQNQTEVEGEEIKLVNLTKIVKRGTEAKIIVQGTPGVEYDIEVYYKSGPSKATGLGPKIAKNSGEVSWSWKVGSRTTPGTYPIVITGGGEELEIKFKVIK